MPQERVLNVKPRWETIPDEERVALLSVDLNDLRLRALDLADKAKKQAGQYSGWLLFCYAATPSGSNLSKEPAGSMSNPQEVTCALLHALAVFKSSGPLAAHHCAQ